MRTRISCILLFMAAFLPAFAFAQASTDFQPPIAIFYVTEFDEPAPVPENWEINSGVWSVANGSYNSTSAPGRAISTITEYVFNPIDPPQTGVSPPYTFRARVRNQRADVPNLAGVVFDYRDAANYNEALFSPNGTFIVWQVRDGSHTFLAAGKYGGGPHVWFDVEVVRDGSNALVKANGVGAVSVDVGPAPQFGGRVGLTTFNTTARFDKVSIAVPFGPQPFKEAFSSGIPTDWFTNGQWSVSGGTLNNTSVQQTSTASTTEFFTEIGANGPFGYTLRARMLNPYGGPGNLVGMYFNQGPCCATGFNGRVEVLFSPRGVARIDVISDGGAAKTIATAAYPGRPNQWFDVRADISTGTISVAVNGSRIFDQVDTDPIFQGTGGLITHWAPGKFDDVWFDNAGSFAPLAVTFDSPPPANWIVSGSWDTSGGTLNSVSAGVSDIVTANCPCWDTDFSYRARLLNQYGASGNLVGLVYNYQRERESSGGPYVGLYTADYYEVVFSPTGQVFINKVLNGDRYRVATGTHNVPRNVWFDVELLRQGVNTTVKVNGATVIDRVPQGELPAGDVGVVSHWSRARFDNLTVTDAPIR